MKTIVIFIVVIGLLAFGANSAYGWYNDQTTQPASAASQKVTFKVTSGESTTEIADDLYAKGLIRNREVFELYVRINGIAPSFQAGDYQLDKHESIRQITLDLQHARTDQISFTIPEGYSIGRTAAKWEAEANSPVTGIELARSDKGSSAYTQRANLRACAVELRALAKQQGAGE